MNTALHATLAPGLLALSALLAACSSDAGGSGGTGGAGGTLSDAAVGGTAAHDGGGGGAGGTATDAAPLPSDAAPEPDGVPVPTDLAPPPGDATPPAPDGAVGPVDEYGFHLRMPTSHDVPCSGFLCEGGTTSAPDKDFVCTLVAPGIDAAVYVQATPSAGDEIEVYLYDPVRAFLSQGGVVSEISGTYDYGGHHANDQIAVEVAGTTYRLGHSSFGFGFRRCQEMDCVQVVEGGEVTNDGCGPDRTLPIVCAAVGEDGTHPPLVDTFAPCPGDPNHP